MSPKLQQQMDRLETKSLLVVAAMALVTLGAAAYFVLSNLAALDALS